jgi:lipoate-protein ligase B
VVLITEHNPVITLGRNADDHNVLAPTSLLQEKGISAVRVERGGDATFHGPGQLVVYPIVDLRAARISVRDYIWTLEEAAIALLDRYGVEGRRRANFPGVWAGDGKIASVGVFTSRWVTMHGIAINIDVDLAGFELIRPCGLEGVRMTSLAAVLRAPPSFVEAESACATIFSRMLNLRRQLSPFTPPAVTTVAGSNSRAADPGAGLATAPARSDRLD